MYYFIGLGLFADGVQPIGPIMEADLYQAKTEEDSLESLNERMNMKLIQYILESKTFNTTANNIYLIYLFSALLLVPVCKGIKYFINSMKRKKPIKDLHPFFSKLEVEKAIKYYIQTKCQNIDPSKEQEPRQTFIFATKEILMNFFINKVFRDIDSEHRHYILLADSGMGKTTFMINLYLKYACKFSKKYRVKLYPLNQKQFEVEIERMNTEEKKQTILLLDAFDEDVKAEDDYKQRIQEIIEKTLYFRKVIITSRTQFFPKETDEPGETKIPKGGGDKGFYVFKKLYISPFDTNDINKYLNKKFGFIRFWNLQKKLKAQTIVRKSLYLMVRPMLLSRIDDLLKANRNFKYSFQIYEELVNQWIERESRRLSSNKRESFFSEMYKFSNDIALYLYNNREKGLYINHEDIEPFAQKNNIDLKIIDLKSRSLLNRDAKGNYKFSHKSILEYFLALKTIENPIFEKKMLLTDNQQIIIFNKEIWEKKINILFKLYKRHSLSFEFIIDGKKMGMFSLRNENQLRELSSMKIDCHNDTININFLKYFTRLRELDLRNIQINNLEPLHGLKNLTKLLLHNNQITNLTQLKELKNLTELGIDNNQITNVAPLKELTKLTAIWLADNQITVFAPLKELTKLRYLDLSGNPMKNSQIEEMRDTHPYTHIVF